MTNIVTPTVLGIAIGTLVDDQLAYDATREEFSDYISYYCMILLRLIRMMIAPLVLRSGRGGGRRGAAHPMPLAAIRMNLLSDGLIVL
jgi:hypothetical protein